MAEEQSRLDPNFVPLSETQMQLLSAAYGALLQASRNWKGALMEVTGEYGLNPHSISVDFKRGGLEIVPSPAPDGDGPKAAQVRSIAAGRKRH